MKHKKGDCILIINTEGSFGNEACIVKIKKYDKGDIIIDKWSWWYEKTDLKNLLKLKEPYKKSSEYDRFKKESLINFKVIRLPEKINERKEAMENMVLLEAL